MTTRKETIKVDYDRDGSFDDQTEITYELTGGKLITKTAITYDLNGGATRTEQTIYTYDEAGNNVGETLYNTQWGGTELEFAHAIEREFDTAGRVSTEVLRSPDFDGNGTLDDYAAITNYAYDSAGRMTFKRTDNTAWGSQAPSDYREETWSYDSQGRITEHRLDDPILYDCEINRTWHYKNGVLQNIKEQNDIRFGDERSRIDESFTWNKDGTPKTHTDWADWSDKGWMQRVDTAYTWKAGYDSQKITYDFEGDFNAEHIKLVENWYNADGRLTHTLISHDDDANGGPLAGGFDSRDLFVKTWDGDTLIAETHDYKADGVLEYEFTSQLLVA